MGTAMIWRASTSAWYRPPSMTVTFTAGLRMAMSDNA